MRSSCIAAALSMLFFGLTAAEAIELKDITYNTENAGKVVFSHKKHLEKKARRDPLQCKGCHENGKKAPEKSNMAGMEKGKSCGACHNGRAAFSVALCVNCHKVREITINVKQTGPVQFSHQKHLKKSPDCAACHNKLFKTARNAPVGMAAMGKGESCGACHNGKSAFPLADCQKCHPYRDKSYKVKDAGNVHFSHKAHMEMSFTCTDCHDAVYKPGKGNPKVSMSKMEEGKSCGACHDGKKAFTVKASCATCHKGS